MEQQVKRIAVFDLDGTSLRGQSGALFSVYLWKRGLVSPRRTLALTAWAAKYKLHLLHDQNRSRELVFGALKGMTASQIEQVMDDFCDEVIIPRIRPAAVREVARLKAQGVVTVLVSATFERIAERSARVLGVDGWVATKMEKDAAGNYTGRVEGEVTAGPGKIRATARWCDEHLGPGQWEIAYAYGDHYTDQELLALAETACAVCPTRTLRRMANRAGWAILDWDHKD